MPAPNLEAIVIKKLSSTGLAAALGVSLMMAGSVAVPAQAKTVNACVKKSTGELRMLTGKKKKCKKGWKKVSWNQKGDTGPQGNPGAQGPNLMVKDGNGQVLGRFLGTFPMGPLLVFVEINGGSYTYMPNGLLYPLGIQSPNFKDNACAGPAYVTSSSPTSTSLITGSAGGPSRIVYRRTNPTFGAPLAWQFSTTTENAVAVQLYERDSSGACTPDGAPYNGQLVKLESVPAPQDVPGPLTIG